MTRREYKAGIPTTLGADITSSSTTITVDTYTNWPTGSGGNFWITIDAGKSQEERILCSAQSSGSITVAASGRGQDGTTASSHTKGATVWPSWSAQDADESNAHIEATGYASFSKSVHGLGSGDGVVVGTDKTQILTAKTLTAPTITSPTISGTITGAVITSANIVNDTILNADINTGAAIDWTKLAVSSTVSATELGYLDGVTGNLANGYRLIGVKTYTTTGSTVYTIATEFPNARALNVKCVGAGGGGGGGATTSANQCAIGGAGGGGGYSEKFILVSSLNATETIKVGAGGTGGSAGANNGTAGGASSFTVAGTETVIGNGGGLGTGDGANSSPYYGGAAGNGGTGSGGDLMVTGSKGGRGFGLRSNGDSMYPVVGGGSQLSPDGVLEAIASGVAGSAGGLYGQGGGGGANSGGQATARAGGAGGQGIVIVEYYA